MVEVIRMRRDLTTPFGNPAWPNGVALAPFHAGRAGELHALLVLAYRDGTGFVDEFPQWWSALSETLSRSCAFLKDLVVRPSSHRRGVGRALLLHLFVTLRTRGVTSVELKVHADNHAGRCLYEQVGMTVTSER